MILVYLKDTSYICLSSLHLFDKKYSNIMKYYYNLK